MQQPTLPTLLAAPKCATSLPHRRWSQASERMIDTGERRPTLPYNGYGEYVAKLYG